MDTRHRLVPLIVLALLPHAAAGADADCQRAAMAAAARWDVPAPVLLAIGRAESGVADAAGGAAVPWPYTVDVDGAGRVYPSAERAAAAIARALAGAARSVDVGCFQINLQAHPNAFASPADGLDPDVNATVAARLLRGLRDRLGDWNAAVAAYHSATPSIGGPYRDRVLGVLRAMLDRSPETVGRVIPVYVPTTLPDGLRPLLRAFGVSIPRQTS